MVNSFGDVFRDNDPCWFSRLESSQVSPSERLEMTHLFSDLHFTRLRNLQLVATEEDHLEDILSRVKPRHVRWFRWYRCSHSSLPDWVPMENLRVLEMEGHSLNVLWSHQSQVGTFILHVISFLRLQTYISYVDTSKHCRGLFSCDS